MFHYTYFVESSSGKYYVGRHTTKNLDDGYLGSGKWPRSCQKNGTLLKKTILEFYPNYESLLAAEKLLLVEHIDKPECMNWNPSPVGFASGDKNPNRAPEAKEKLSKRAKENNPMKNGHTEESKKKISEALSGTNNPMYGKRHSEKSRKLISENRTPIDFTPELRKKLSDAHKRGYENGRTPSSGFTGMKHSFETKKKMAISAQKREKKTCPHCGKKSAVNTYSRWHGDKCAAVFS